MNGALCMVLLVEKGRMSGRGEAVRMVDLLEVEMQADSCVQT